MMPKSFIFRLFGFGKISADRLLTLRQEGLLLLDEGLTGSVTYKNFRSPGRMSTWKRKGLIASIALPNERLLAVSFSNPLIDIPLSDPRFGTINFSLEKDVLCISFDPSLFHDDWSGTIEYRFNTTKAQHCLNLIQQF
jgi:hypothetical protein